MDLWAFGVLKRQRSRLHDDAKHECPGRAWTEADVVLTIIDAWAEIDATVVESALQRACGEAEGV
jgi:hypothetical protein